MSRKILLAIGIAVLAFLAVNNVFADFRAKSAAKKQDIKRIIRYASITSKVPFVYLGRGIDSRTDKLVDGYAIIHQDRSKKLAGGKFVKDARKGFRQRRCYDFFAKGAKWKVAENYIVDTYSLLSASTTSTLTPEFVRNNIASNITKWESAAGKNIVADGYEGIVDGADVYYPDGKNEVYFDLFDPGTIAVTVIWGVFGGPVRQRMLVEWDQVYNNYYNWSSNGEPGKMDFENISTHELGHSIGLADLYNTGCSEQTMYGYADYGETKKRTLEIGDIIGARRLYR